LRGGACPVQGRHVRRRTSISPIVLARDEFGQQRFGAPPGVDLAGRVAGSQDEQLDGLSGSHGVPQVSSAPHQDVQRHRGELVAQRPDQRVRVVLAGFGPSLAACCGQDMSQVPLHGRDLDLVPGLLPDRQRIALVAFGQAVGASPAFQNAPLAEAPGDIRPVIGRAGSLQAFLVQPFSGGGVALGAADIAQHDQHGARVAPPDLAVERHALFDVFLGALGVAQQQRQPGLFAQ